MENYTVLHCHSDMSNGVTNIDSVTKYQEYISRAKELDMTAMAISEHGSVFAWDKKKEEMEKYGLKYIHAEEFYVTEKIDVDERGNPIKLRDNWHCLLISRNFDGVKELNRLASKSFNRKDGHYYYVPRIELSDLLNTSENIIILSACLGGILNRAPGNIQKQFLDFMAKHKDRCFLEIQHHNVPDQKIYNQKLYDLSREYDLQLVACTDTHSLNEKHADGRKILQLSKNIRFDDEEGWDLTFKSYDELCTAYEKQGALPKEVYLKAIENTNKIADMIETFEIDRSIKYPHIYDNALETFKRKINEGYKNNKYLQERYPRKVVSQRLKEELSVYEKVGAIDFMLLQSYIREWERANGVQSGYGRGSVSGSLIAYTLGVTQMDSLKFNLNFFRFLNPSRVTNSDVDTDYSSKDREKLKYFMLHDKLNLPNIKTSEIITFNTIATKGAIKDVCRALNISLDEAQQISDAVNMDGTIDDEWKERYPEVFKYVDIVSGTIVSIGSHPSGVLVSDRDIESDIGLCSLSTSDYPVSMLDMKSLDAQMYVKEDVLGLDNIGLINDTCKMAGIERLTPDNVDLNDKKVWESIRDDTTLIFQWESDSAQTYLKKFMSDETIAKAKEKDKNFSYIKWFSFGNGLIRPSCASFRDDVACGKFYDNGFKELNEFLAPEAGRVAMQETIMRWLQKFCGYSPAESDNVRRCVDEDTLVLMGDGNYKKIKDLNVGDIVQSFNKYNVSEPQNVISVFDNGVAQTYKVKTQHGYELIATDSHKVLTQRGYIPLKELTVNDFIMTPKCINASDDGLLPQKRLSEKQMFMIGLLIGDGSIGKDDTIHFTNHELALVEKYQDCVKSIECKGDCTFSVVYQDGVNVDRIYSVYITSENYRNSVINLLYKLGIRTKSANKHIPDCIMEYPKGGKILNLLAGLFNTDGGYNNRQQYIEYSSISKTLILQIKSLLLKYNIYSYISQSYVKGYDYYSYRLIIQQPESLINFSNYILPLIIGEKRKNFSGTIHNAINNQKKFNYLLPNECKNEVLNMSEMTNTSIRSLGTRIGESDLSVHKGEFGISDTKARHIVEKMFCPKTYELLMADYIPVRVKSIEYIGERHVYDIEVNENHNYIANNLIVHNCIAKKKGTEQLLPEIEQRFIEYSSTHYDITKERCQEVIKPFLKIILDASAYGFSWNHSDAYSCIGYISGYLRYYHTLEFLTSAFNTFTGKEDKIVAITKYADKVGIKIQPPKFRHSRSGYQMDKETNSIYKGLESIKYLNADVSDQLYEMRDAHFDNFIDFLNVSPLDSRQLQILVELDFFSEFAKSQKLLKIIDLYNLLHGKRQIKKEKTELPVDVLEKYCVSETAKMYKFDDEHMDAMLSELCNNIPNQDIPLQTKLQTEHETLGYISYTDPSRPNTAVIMDFNTKYSTFRAQLYRLYDGQTITVKIKKKTYEQMPIAVGMVINYRTEKQPAWKMDENGKWQKDYSREDTWLSSYSIE